MPEQPERLPAETIPPSMDTLRALEDLLPGVIADGVIDAQRISDAVGLPVSATADGKERFGLMWAGKSDAIQVLQRPSLASLIPNPEKSIKFETSQDILIEGDNLEVLKLLQKSYNDKVQLIYIDPPYNTGNDFIYTDNFANSLDHYLFLTQQQDSDGLRLTANVETSGRLHSNWLSMMYPRLVLGRNLLTIDGCICVSIDYNESANLRLLMNEIFGETNFVGELAVTRSEGGGLAKHLVQAHDSLLIYARDLTHFSPLLRAKDIRGKVVEKNEEKYWIEEDWLRKEFGKYGTLTYEEIESVKGAEFLQEVDSKIASGDYVLIQKGEKSHIVGRLRNLATDGSKFSSAVKHLNKDGKARLAELGMDNFFDFPKPVSLIKSLVLGATFTKRKENAIVLDFFAGSGTTADAVLQQNLEDGGNTRYILVNAPEKLPVDSVAYLNGLRKVSDITTERVRRVLAKIGAKDALGFKLYTLGESCFRHDVVQSEETKTPELFASTLSKPPIQLDILSEIQLKFGLTLDSLITKMKVAGRDVFICDNLAMILELNIDQDFLDGVLVEVKANSYVFLEDSFADKDAMRANAFFGFRNANKIMKTI